MHKFLVKCIIVLCIKCQFSDYYFHEGMYVIAKRFYFLQKLNLVTSKLINHVALLSKIDTYDFFNHDRVSHDCVIILGTIYLRRRQIFTIFDPYPLPSAVFYYYPSANLANF